jgi:hypothetical protein
MFELIPLAGIGLTALIVLQVGSIIKAAINRKRDVTPRDLVALDDRLERIEHAIDAMAVEVERISEGQRFTTKLLAERAPAASGEPHA